jgi:hypothetical protein
MSSNCLRAKQILELEASTFSPERKRMAVRLWPIRYSETVNKQIGNNAYKPQNQEDSVIK